MAEPFLSEIRLVSFNFAPSGWAFCNGQLMPINQNQALFSLLGTTFGGNGQTTFGLPGLMGRAAMHPGQGPGLSLHDLGEQGGTDYVALLTSEIPVHTHTVSASLAEAADRLPGDQQFAQAVGMGMYAVPGTQVQLAPQALAPAGASQPHNNLQGRRSCASSSRRSTRTGASITPARASPWCSSTESPSAACT